MEGLPELKQILRDIGMPLADREYVANRWASEVEALRQRPGAQAASEPTTAKPCTGMNCGATDGRSHSRECLDEHDATVREASLAERPLWDANNPRDGYCTDREWRERQIAATPAGERPVQAEPLMRMVPLSLLVRAREHAPYMGETWKALNEAMTTLGAQAPSTAAPMAVETAGAQKYDDVLLPFLTLMRRELHANSGKGDRPGWLRMDASTALLEVYWHAAKLSAAVKNNDGPAIQEHSADVANMAMMVLDVCGGLVWIEPDASTESADSPDAQLCKFYGVTTFPELVTAMAHHIEKLQAKLPPSPSMAPQQVRQG